MPKTRAESRAALIEAAQDFVKEHEDAQGLLSVEHQNHVQSLLDAAELLRDGNEVRTTADLGKEWANMQRINGRPGLSFVDTNGRTVTALTPSEAICEAPAAGEPRVGEFVRSMVTGNWGEGGIGQFASMIGGSGTGGGYLLTPRASGMVLDLARANSVVMKAGAQTIPMQGESELTIARILSDPTAHWRPEGGKITASSMSFGQIRLAPRTIGALVPVSVELVEDAKNIVDIIEAAIAAAMGLAIDKAALMGTPQNANDAIGASITGVINEAENSVATVGTPTDYSKVTTGIGKIIQANYPVDQIGSLAWIAHPRDWETFDKLEDSTGQPLQPTPWAAALTKKLSTTSLPTNLGGGTNESQMIIGDFSEVLFGMRTQGIQIEVFRAGRAQDENGIEIEAVDHMLVWIRAYMRLDVATLRPSFFTKFTGVTAA